jgi:hypothetical protein
LERALNAETRRTRRKRGGMEDKQHFESAEAAEVRWADAPGYLAEVLASQRVGAEVEGAVRARRVEVEELLGFGAGVRVYFGGSFAKRTAVAAGFDLDVVVYFGAGCGLGVRSIYEDVEKRLMRRHVVVRHGVALRLQYTPGWHVDVVPGRALSESYEYADLWHSERSASRQTSLKRHIELARSGDREVVRLLKIWRVRHRVPVGSFVLELAAARVAGDGELEERFRRALEVLARFEELRLVDPANSANVVTDDIEWGRKREIADLAARSLGEGSWDRVVW